MSAHLRNPGWYRAGLWTVIGIAFSVGLSALTRWAYDYDDLAEWFGADVAGWVVALTKDMRLPEQEREAAYARQLVAAGWQVAACKLADIYDNLGDCRTRSADARRRTAARSRAYLDALRPVVTPAIEPAFRAVADRLAAVEGSLGS